MKEQIIQLHIDSEMDCNILDDEYSINIVGMIGYIDCLGNGGECDSDKIRECVYEWISDNKEHLKNDTKYDTNIQLTVSERYERQDVFTFKFFEADSSAINRH